MQPIIMSDLISTTSIRAYNSGINAERSRIIKILKALPIEFSNNDHDEDGHEMIGEFKSDLIALIKGEQK